PVALLDVESLIEIARAGPVDGHEGHVREILERGIVDARVGHELAHLALHVFGERRIEEVGRDEHVHLGQRAPSWGERVARAPAVTVKYGADDASRACLAEWLRLASRQTRRGRTGDEQIADG